MATVVRFQAKPSQFFFCFFFAIFDSLVAITSRPGAQNSRSGSFGANNDAGQTDKPIALPRFAHARGVMRKSDDSLLIKDHEPSLYTNHASLLSIPSVTSSP